MSELDPHLASLLRRGPAPPEALDPAHRQAVLAAARQTWFRQRARSRRNLLALAAAAVFAAAIAGWTVRSLLDSVSTPVSTPVVAQAEKRAEPAPAPPVAPAPMATALEAAAAPASAPLADADTAQGFAAAAPMMAAKPAETEPTANARSDALRRTVTKAAGATASPPPLAIPPDAPGRGRLLAAATILDAALSHRLQPDERIPALQAALELLAGLDQPAAADLRMRIEAALRLR